jgi:hypothetical protein
MRQDAKKRVNLARYLAQTKRNSLYPTASKVAAVPA